MKRDVYERVTDKIIADLEGACALAEAVERRACRRAHHAPSARKRHPLSRHQYSHALGSRDGAGFAAPIWMTFKQALEHGAHVRKGEQGHHVVYATPSPHASNEQTGRREQRIPFLKGYNVFNVEQIDGLPAHFHARRRSRSAPAIERIAVPKRSSPRPARIQPRRQHGLFRRRRTTCRCRLSRPSAMLKATTPPSRMKHPLDAPQKAPCPRFRAQAFGEKGTRWRSLSPSLVRRSFAPTSA